MEGRPPYETATRRQRVNSLDASDRDPRASALATLSSHGDFLPGDASRSPGPPRVRLGRCAPSKGSLGKGGKEVASCFGIKVLRSAKGKRSPESLLTDTDEVRSERESTRAYDERPHSKRSKRGQGGRGRMQARGREGERASEKRDAMVHIHAYMNRAGTCTKREREREEAMA